MYVRSSIRQTIFKTVMLVGALFAVTMLLAAIPAHRAPRVVYVPPQEPASQAQTAEQTTQPQSEPQPLPQPQTSSPRRKMPR